MYIVIKYIVYIKLCKICLITFTCWYKAHMSHLFIIFFSSIPASGRYIGEISKLALVSIKILHFNWQIVGHNQNFDFCPAVNEIYF